MSRALLVCGKARRERLWRSGGFMTLRVAGAYLQGLSLQMEAQRSLQDMSGSMLNLSYELWMRIFGFLSLQEQVRVMSVSKV